MAMKVATTGTKVLTAFDMDGTIADLYGVKGWLDYIKDEDTFPFDNAKLLVNLVGLQNYLSHLRSEGHRLAIISWTPKDASQNYCKAVRKAKIEWLKKFGLLKYFDEIHIVAYGTPKHQIAVKRRRYEYSTYAIYDDQENVRTAWESNKTSKVMRTTPTKNRLGLSEFSLRVNCNLFALTD